jgi:hypothetical protein
VQEVCGRDAVEPADPAQRRGVRDPVLDAERLRLFLLPRRRDHLRRDVDAHDAAGAPTA